jgi:hypothetical protein
MAKKTLEWPGRRADDPAHDRIDAFLVLDIQRDRASAEELLGKIAAVRSGALPSWERTGNAHHLRLEHAGAVIEDTVDASSRPQRVSLQDLAAAASAWLASI